MFACQQCRREIETAARSETLSVPAATHLDACAGCRAFRSERQRLRSLLGELEPITAPPDFEFRLRARMAARPGAPARRMSWLTFTPRFAGLALAACLVLAAAATLRWRESQTTSSDP